MRRIFLLLLAVLALGCAKPLDTSIRASNAATLVLVELRQPLMNQFEDDLEMANSQAEVEIVKGKWMPVLFAFDTLLEARAVMLSTIKASANPEKFGTHVSQAELLGNVAALYAAMDRFVFLYKQAARWMDPMVEEVAKQR